MSSDYCALSSVRLRTWPGAGGDLHDTRHGRDRWVLFSLSDRSRDPLQKSDGLSRLSSFKARAARWRDSARGPRSFAAGQTVLHCRLKGRLAGSTHSFERALVFPSRHRFLQRVVPGPITPPRFGRRTFLPGHPFVVLFTVTEWHLSTGWALVGLSGVTRIAP
jgi:hypothetical protein